MSVNNESLNKFSTRKTLLFIFLLSKHNFPPNFLPEVNLHPESVI